MAGVSGSLWEEEQFVALVVKKKERDLPHSKIIRKHNSEFSRNNCSLNTYVSPQDSQHYSSHMTLASALQRNFSFPLLMASQ